MDRFKILVFSFYREEYEILREINTLVSCRILKSGGTIFINCKDENHFFEIHSIIHHLKKPFRAIGICRQIVIRSPRLKEIKYDVHSLASSSFPIED